MTSNREHKNTGVNLRRAPITMKNEEIRALNSLGALSSINPLDRNPSVPLSTNYLHNSPRYPGMQNVRTHVGPPPLPPRPNQTFSSTFNRYPGMSSYGNYYSPYSPFSSGLYSSYGCRSPYNRFGNPPEPNSFVQLAEESSRPAFESIESVVQVVSSISMMLESTYHAVHSSYSAILGVVDQFSRLREHFAQVLSFLALLRGLRWICLKILYLLKLRKDNPTVDSAWKSAEKVTNTSDIVEFGDDGKSPWPFFIFLSLAIGAPWLMFKLLTRNIQKKPFDIRMWLDENGKYLTAVAAYDFLQSRPGEIAFSAGDKLYIAPKSFQVNTPKGWLLACNMNKNKVTGFIPCNYLLPTATRGKYDGHNAPVRVPAYGRISHPSTDLINEETDGRFMNPTSVHQAVQDFPQNEETQEDALQSEITKEYISGTDVSEKVSLEPEGAAASISEVKTVPGTICETDALKETVSQPNDVPHREDSNLFGINKEERNCS